MSIKKLVLTLFSASAGGSIGYLFGKALHNAIVYYPILKFQNYSWFNASQYLNLYYQYSNGLDNLLGFIFGLLGFTIGGLIGYQIAEALDYDDKRYKFIYGGL